MAAIFLHGYDPQELERQRRANPDPGPVTIPSPTYASERQRLEAEARAAAKPARASGPADEKYVLVDGKYRLNPKYNPPFDITLGQAIAIPPLVAATGALAPEAVAAAARLLAFARRGGELSFGPHLRIAPFGNRTSPPHPTGRLPHYHRRSSFDPPKGQGIGRHRPWDKRNDYDGSWRDRF